MPCNATPVNYLLGLYELYYNALFRLNRLRGIIPNFNIITHISAPCHRSIDIALSAVYRTDDISGAFLVREGTYLIYTGSRRIQTLGI